MKKYLFSFASLLCCFLVYGQENSNGIQYAKGEKIGVIESMQSLGSDVPTERVLKKEKTSKALKAVPNFHQKKAAPNFREKSYPKNGDPIRTRIQQNAGPGLINLALDIEGIEFDPQAPIYPPDCNGDIGINYYIESVNAVGGSKIRIIDKNGVTVKESLMSYLWEPLGVQTLGDPVIFFDRMEKRWIISEFSNFKSETYMAISKTDDPLGAFDVYKIPTESFPDYPKFGNWNDAYFMASNEYQGTTPIYAIDKAAMLAGEADVTVIQFKNIIKLGAQNFFHVAAAIDLAGNKLPKENTDFIAIRLYDDAWVANETEPDGLEYYVYDPDFENPAASKMEGPFFLKTEAFDTQLCDDGLFTCTKQSNGNKVSVIPNTIMQKTQYYNHGTYESILLNFAVDVNGEDKAGIRWIELRKTDNKDWHIHSEQTLESDDESSLFMGSITQDIQGNISMLYAKAGETVDLSLWVATKLNGSSSNQFDDYYEISKGYRPSSVVRWGDYFSLTVDPVDNKTFWYTGEYMPENPDLAWSTKVGAFKLDRDTFDLGITAFLSPDNSMNYTNEETIKVRIFNPGIEPMDSFVVAYAVNGTLKETDTVTTALLPSEVYEHTFDTKEDMSEVGSIFNFTAIVAHPRDENMFNDTLKRSFKKLANLDVIALKFDNILSGCETSYEIDIHVENGGLDTIKSLEYELDLNGNVSTESVTGLNIAPGAKGSFMQALTLIEGDNNGKITFMKVNGGLDQITENNVSTFTVEIFNESGTYTLDMYSDRYAQDITWTIETLDGTVLFEGGEYENNVPCEVKLPVCLRDTCFNFVLKDLFGDGWTSQDSIPPHCFLTDSDGVKIFEMTDFNFGKEWVVQFCTDKSCDIEYSTIVQDASSADSADGSIVFSVTSPNKNNITYSIDGGQNFQASPVFLNLLPAEYYFVLKANDYCAIEDAVKVDFFVSTTKEEIDEQLVLNPNPSNGILSIHLKDVQAGDALPFYIVNELGELVFKSTLAQFNTGYKRQINVTGLTPGVYFLIVHDPSFVKMGKFIRQ